MSGSNDRFSVQLPDGWTDRTIHYFQGPEDGGLQHGLSLAIDREPDTKDVAEYGRTRLQVALDAIPGAELVKEEATTAPDGSEVFSAVYKWAGAEGSAVFSRQVYLLRDNTAYTFIGHFNKKTLQTLAVDFDRIIASFAPVQR